MARYQHDQSFASLKRTEEQVEGNYTSSQYLKTLDHFLWQAVDPIVNTCPSFAANYFSKVVAQQMVRVNKMTSDDRSLLPVQFVNYLLGDKQQLRNMHFNRGVLFGLITLFRESTADYMKAASSSLPSNVAALSKSLSVRREAEIRLGVQKGFSLYSTCLSVEHWQAEAIKFKNAIVEKYIRLALTQAKRTYEEVDYQIPLGDIVGEYMLIVPRAIDRCDSRHGVLTTFIQNWFKSARSKIMDRVMENASTDSYDAILDSEEGPPAEWSNLPNADMETLQALAELAKRVDPQGCVRASFGIPEHVSYKDRQTLMCYTAKDEAWKTETPEALRARSKPSTKK